jgi:eukaryotic-like serine/threonine-protein kinase
MREGEVVDGRFEIERYAGSGGMGHVFRARDQETGEAVALKVLQSAGTLGTSRFVREAQALAAVRVPGVVRYVAHGTARDGQLYLAMEWLEGETLADRLAREALSAAESVRLGARVATTLGRVHRLGIVHRDLKPGNLLLPGGRLDEVMVIDFGIARIPGVEQQLTMAGAIVGTPGYMAPEQARGQREIDARTDVFALGCVLYECLTGQPAFQGAGLALLARVILDEPPRIREIRAELPEHLDDLVGRMLAKSAVDRPADGEAVAAELAAIERLGMNGTRETSAAPGQQAQGLSTGERRVMCLVLAQEVCAADDATLAEEEQLGHVQTLSTLAQQHRGQLEMLNGRSPLIVFSDALVARDLAAQAARCALALQPLLSGASIVVATGRAEVETRVPVGELIDRAVRLLATQTPGGAGDVRIDEVTAALLRAGFEIAQDERGHILRGAQDDLDESPLLLGKPTVCVGRDREIALLMGDLRHCLEEHAASAALVIGAPGTGKSRLRQEVVRALRESDQTVEIWLGQADPMSAGSAFSLLAHALRRGLDLAVGEPIEERRRKIQKRVERHRALDAARVAAFLGELVGSPFPDDHDVQLRAARSNPMLMGDQIRFAWEEFLQAECAAHPVLLVLEDLHWGDLPTVQMVSAALRQLSELPFMVLALSRPEVHELFPKLWEGQRVHEVRLGPLPRRASEQLVRWALGEHVTSELVQTVVQRADGNAFYLEEQIRAVASGKAESLPESVLAMVQAEIEALDPDARRVLRAASIFGETFRQDEVTALAGGVRLAPMLLALERREVIRRGRAHVASDAEYRFRHALVREAAYGMLTERDRQLGHALAGDWLEQRGDADPMALAEHFERGGAPARAATAYLHAAQQALRGDDLDAALERAERGIACGAEHAIYGALRLVQAEASCWRGEFTTAKQRALEAIEHLSPGSAAWFSAITRQTTAATNLAEFDLVERWMAAAHNMHADDQAVTAKAICLCDGAFQLAFGGRHELADAMLDAASRTVKSLAGNDIELVAHLQQTRMIRAAVHGDFGTALEEAAATLDAFDHAGDRRNACTTRLNLGAIQGQLGHFEDSERTLREALTTAERMGLREIVAIALSYLGLVLAYLGQLDEARIVQDAAITRVHQLNSLRAEGCAHCYLANILILTGDFSAAEREARRAVELQKSTPPLRAFSAALLARALLALGRTTEALEAARDALALLESVGAEEGESLIRLVHAEALDASGSRPEALAAIASARDNLLARAARISDPLWRESFLCKVPDNARTLELARRWLGETPPLA